MSKFVVVDEIIEMLEAAKSGVVPGSVCQAVVSGVQNVPANIIQHDGNAGGGCYTTFPLSPILKNCCLDKTYLNLEFDVNIKFTPTGAAENDIIPCYVGFRDSAAVFNQVQILIENSALITTTYHREESVLAYNALPETEIRGNNQYASIEKLRLGKYCPMKRILLKVGAGGTKTNPEITTIHYKLTVDINRLMPVLSNIHFTTPHFGNLKLKVWLQKIQEAMFFCPDYSYYAFKNFTAATDKSPSNEELRKAFAQPLQNQYWSFYPLGSFMGKVIDKGQIPFYAYNSNEIKLVDSVQFSYPGTSNFMTFNGGVAEIVQTCFDIKEEEYQRLSDYFASTNSIIIPTQTFESGVFNNSGIDAGTNWLPSQIGTIGGYNVNSISVWCHPVNQTTCFMKEFLTNIQLLLDGRPINSLPYAYVNDKAVVDCTQAIIDTDHEEINQDYIDSLTGFNLTDDDKYINEKLQTTYGTGALSSSVHRCYISNPNTYCLNFSTNLPDAFHSGACILENSNRNGVVRFNSGSACDSNDLLKLDTNGIKLFPYVPTHRNCDAMNAGSSTVGFTAFCDCCLVLTYDAARGTCYDGQLSWAAPYL